MQILVTSGSALQIVMGTLFSAIFLLLQARAHPYVSPYNDYLAAMCSFSTVAVFLISVAFKYDAP